MSQGRDRSAMRQEASLSRIWAARDRLKELERDMTASDKLPNAREELAEAVQALLSEVAAHDVGEAERRALDEALAPHASDLKGALLKALRLCCCARGFLGLPALMEATRVLLCAAPAKGVATYLEDALCADIDRIQEARALIAVADVMNFMTGVDLNTRQPRLKRDLHGHQLPATHKKSCRTALNRATRALATLETASGSAQGAGHPTAPRHEMERDVRLDDADDAAARNAAHQAAMDVLFAHGHAGSSTQ